MNLGMKEVISLSIVLKINMLTIVKGLLLAPIIVSGPHNLKRTETRIAAGFFVPEES
jgi:hypothetical protein